MTAALNVFGNVFQYDEISDLDVFGNVFEWVIPVPTPSPGMGFTMGRVERIFQPGFTGSRVVVASRSPRILNIPEKQ